MVKYKTQKENLPVLRTIQNTTRIHVCLSAWIKYYENLHVLWESGTWELNYCVNQYCEKEPYVYLMAESRPVYNIILITSESLWRLSNLSRLPPLWAWISEPSPQRFPFLKWTRWSRHKGRGKPLLCLPRCYPAAEPEAPPVVNSSRRCSSQFLFYLLLICLRRIDILRSIPFTRVEFFSLLSSYNSDWSRHFYQFPRN
jgi:hypothetical protein